MNVRKILLPLGVLVVAALGAFALLATAPAVENVASVKPLTAVRALEVTPGDVPMVVRSQGTVAPRTESNLVPEVSGTVVWVSPALVSGGFFAKDEPLLRIDARDYEAAAARARAEVARAEGEAEHAAAELRRQEGLARSKANSPSQLSNARRAQRVAKASLEAARVSLEQAERDVVRTEVTAPFDGRVRDEQIDVGQFVSRGVAVATVYATDFAEIRLPIADPQLAYLDLPTMRGDAEWSEGPVVTLRAHFAGAEHSWQGHVVRTEGEIDPESRMVHVVARVEDPYGIAGESVDEEEGSPTTRGAQVALAVGLFVRAEIEGPTAHDVIVVPRSAMRNGDRVLVVDVEDRLQRRPVEILRIDREEVVIRTALREGDRVVVSPIQVVVDGMQVQPILDEVVGS